MGRYTGPACKRCRREGMRLFLKGARCSMSKCPIETGRPAPGMHGQRRGRKMSDYGIQLREKQRLRRQYGLQEKQFHLFFERVAHQRGVTGELFLKALESRLDNIVYRLGFAPSRRAARQFVTHGHVTVNGNVASIPSMIISAGAVIGIKEKTSSKAQAAACLEAAEGREMPAWMTMDVKTMKGEFVRVPTRDEIAPIVDEQLVVELYSK
ncbi:MAG: 30S ribosomal protein S4 [Kiritimatiellae bacterium]|nr:30S ribosomal protein S4 [Kiritimatiellia bacterium]